MRWSNVCRCEARTKNACCLTVDKAVSDESHNAHENEGRGCNTAEVRKPFDENQACCFAVQFTYPFC